MRPVLAISLLLVSGATALPAPAGKPALRVARDGFPGGHSSPEGAACDLARAFILHNAILFRSTCIQPFGGGESRKAYNSFLGKVARQMVLEGKKATPSPNGPKSIGKVFAARHLSRNGPASYGYAAFGFKDVQFVDVGVMLHNGKPMLNRTLVLQKADGQWYAHPMPAAAPLLSEGLNAEPASKKDFSEVYDVK